MRYKEKENKFDYNNHTLIVINLTWTDVITIEVSTVFYNVGAA